MTGVQTCALPILDIDEAFDQKAAKGFIDIQGLSIKTWAMKGAAHTQGGTPAPTSFDVLDGTADSHTASRAVNF